MFDRYRGQSSAPLHPIQDGGTSVSDSVWPESTVPLPLDDGGSRPRFKLQIASLINYLEASAGQRGFGSLSQVNVEIRTRLVPKNAEIDKATTEFIPVPARITFFDAVSGKVLLRYNQSSFDTEDLNAHWYGFTREVIPGQEKFNKLTIEDGVIRLFFNQAIAQYNTITDEHRFTSSMYLDRQTAHLHCERLTINFMRIVQFININERIAAREHAGEVTRDLEFERFKLLENYRVHRCTRTVFYSLLESFKSYRESYSFIDFYDWYFDSVKNYVVDENGNGICMDPSALARLNKGVRAMLPDGGTLDKNFGRTILSKAHKVFAAHPLHIKALNDAVKDILLFQKMKSAKA